MYFADGYFTMIDTDQKITTERLGLKIHMFV